MTSHVGGAASSAPRGDLAVESRPTHLVLTAEERLPRKGRGLLARPPQGGGVDALVPLGSRTGSCPRSRRSFLLEEPAFSVKVVRYCRPGDTQRIPWSIWVGEHKLAAYGKLS